MTPEHQQLQQCLDSQRHHILGAVAGLGDEQLRQPVLRSGWSCAGLIQHLTLAVERYWFHSIVGGEPLGWFPTAPGADWQIAAGTPAQDVIDTYRREVARSNKVFESTRPDAAPQQRDPLWDEWGADFPDVRGIVLHVIAETATHAGHLDAARELLDGKQWLVLA